MSLNLKLKDYGGVLPDLTKKEDEEMLMLTYYERPNIMKQIKIDKVLKIVELYDKTGKVAHLELEDEDFSKLLKKARSIEYLKDFEEFYEELKKTTEEVEMTYYWNKLHKIVDILLDIDDVKRRIKSLKIRTR
jgi:hypothetical protein